MRIKIILSVVVLYIALPTVSWSQASAAEHDWRDTVVRSSVFSIALQPFKAAVNCAKLDLEYKFAESPFAVVFSPEVYEGTDTAADRAVFNASLKSVAISGWGMTPGVKIYFDNGFGIINRLYDLIRVNHYISVQAVYRSFDLAYQNRVWTPTSQLPFPAFELRWGEVNTQVTQVGATICYGFNVVILKRLLLEGFLGAGYVRSRRTVSLIENEPFEDNYFTVTGTVVSAGLKIGVIFF
ncbi:MAG: hypothetical protein JNL32_06290 [Candidatus Kapabacteria bacterium]|nr:hypothetical protein [Candidatus Kapabacteria bacterium]